MVRVLKRKESEFTLVFCFVRFLQKVNLVFQFGQQTFDTAGVAYSSPATREYGRGPSPEWLHMQVGGGFDRT